MAIMHIEGVANVSTTFSSGIGEKAALPLRILGCLLPLLLIWRFWRFTISPLLNPQDPKQLPYWFPVIGHGFAFFKNAPAVLCEADNHFHSTKEPYAVTLFGQSIYIITKPQDTVEVYKNSKTLTFEEFVINILKQTGMSQAGVRRVNDPLPKDKSGFPNPNGDALSTLVRSVHMVQAYPGHNLKILDRHFIDWFDRNFRLPALEKLCVNYAVSLAEGGLQVPLWKFCSQMQVQAAGDSYFGPSLGNIEPDFAAIFLKFDDLCWQLLYEYPSLFTGELTGALRKMQSALQRYFEIPQTQRKGQLWQINTMENELRNVEISNEDIGILFFNIFWGINTNSRKTVFWMLSYILHNPSQIEVLRQEIAPAFRGDQLVDPEYLYENCPQLADIWHETLRVYSHAVSARFIKADTIIGGKLLRKGHRIMIPFRMLHFDRSTWGEDAGTFRPNRFAKRTNELTKSPSWRPFGGGKSLCSGRYVAKHLACMFTATLLHRFDVAKIDQSPFPLGDEGKPVLGMMSIKDTEDYMVRISSRKPEL